MEGAFKYHDVDATAAIFTNAGAAGNAGCAMAVEVFRSYDWGLDCKTWLPENDQVSCRGRSKTEATDLAITFVDWAPAVPDANMGFWRGVELSLPPAAAPVTIRYPQVATTLSKSNSFAHLEVMAEFHNWDPTRTVRGVISVELGSLLTLMPASKTSTSTAPVVLTLAPGETRQVVINRTAAVSSDVLWWPWQMGQPTQHNLTWTFVPTVYTGASRTPTAVVDTNVVTCTTLVGLREATSLNDANGNVVVRVNGQRILIRGGVSDSCIFCAATSLNKATVHVCQRPSSCVCMLSY